MAKIFISASSGDLKNARKLVAECLRQREFDCEVQNEYPMQFGQVAKMLSDKINPCVAVIQLVGFRYGAEPNPPKTEFGRVSYTQFEALYAGKLGKPVFYILIDRAYPVLKCKPESKVRQELQLAYRNKLAKGNELYEPIKSRAKLRERVSVLKLPSNLPPSVSSTLPWHPPRAADKFFGRLDEITVVADLLRQHRCVALTGAGGMGKTALARKVIDSLAPLREQPGPFPGGIYSHDYYQSPGHPAALSSILAQAGVEQTPDRDRPGVVTRLLDQPGVLLYLEGCEKAEQLFELLNLSSQVKVLLTTRDPDKSGGGHPHKLHSLDPESAAGLLAYHAGQRLPDSDPPVEASEVGRATPCAPGQEPTPIGAHGVPRPTLLQTAGRQPWLDLAKRLGHHPLALLLAGVYLLHRKQTPVQFLDHLTRGGFALWDTHLEPKENLQVMFGHSADAATAKHPRALEAWFALALHAHAPVPLSALCGALACDADEAELRLAALQDYSLAEPVEMPGAKVGETERAWQLTHALLGEWAREQSLPKRSADLRIGTMEPADPAPVRRPALQHQKILTAWLDWWLQDLRHCFKQRSVPGGPARYQALQPHWNALLTILDQTEGNDSNRLSFFLNETASAHQDMGNYSAAEPLFRRDLEVRERVLGPEHPGTLTSVNNLAFLLKAKGDLVAAEPLYRRALEVRERVLGPEHPNTLTSVNNLAELLRNKGDWATAEPLYRRALEASERVLGPEHPDTLISVNNLATFYGMQGDWRTALPLHERAAQGALNKLGPDHPNTKLYQKHLAYVRQELAEQQKP